MQELFSFVLRLILREQKPKGGNTLKKYLVLFLALILLLTSCKVTTVSTRSPNVFSVDSLPDIGRFSGLSGEKHFYDEPVYDFIPSDEYGKIVPFVGTYRVFETPKEEGSDWHAKQGYSTYGFCTLDGKTVMDASDKNAYVYFRQTDDGFGFYTLTREILPKDDAPDEYLPNETYIIPLDGSWCLKLQSGSWLSAAGGGYLCICEYPEVGSVKTHLYNYDGELVKTFDDVDNVGVVSNGLMLVSSWTQDGYTAHFVNEDGETVLGPYTSASDFNKHGITAVNDGNGAFLINSEGERLTDYYESFFKEFSNDSTHHVFSARHKENNKISDVYSDKGEYLGIAEGSTYFSYRFPDNGNVLYYYTHFDNNDKGYPIYNSERMIWKRLSDGSDFVSKEFGFGPNSYSGTDNCFIYTDKENKTGYLFDANGETLAVIEGASEIATVSDKGEYAVFVEGEYDYNYDEETGKPLPDTRKTYIYDSKNAKIIYSVNAYAGSYAPDKNKRFIMLTVYDGTDMYDMFGGDPKYTLFDTQSGKVVFESCNQIALYDIGDKTYINVCTENSSALYDEDFNVIRKAYFE